MGLKYVIPTHAVLLSLFTVSCCQQCWYWRYRKELPLPNSSFFINVRTGLLFGLLLVSQHKTKITWWTNPMLTLNTGWGEDPLQLLVTHTNFDVLGSLERMVSCGGTIQAPHMSLAARSVVLRSLWPPPPETNSSSLKYCASQSNETRAAECRMSNVWIGGGHTVAFHPTTPLREPEEVTGRKYAANAKL